MMTHKEALLVAIFNFGKSHLPLEDSVEGILRDYIEARGLVLAIKEPIGFIAEGVPGLLKEGLQGSVFVNSTHGPREIPIYAAAPDPFGDE